MAISQETRIGRSRSYLQPPWGSLGGKRKENMRGIGQKKRKEWGALEGKSPQGFSGA